MENRLILALFATCLPLSCQAQGIAEEITAITERVHMLNAKKAEMDLRSEIAKREQELERYGSGRFQSHAGQAIAVVKTIEGIDGRLLATLTYPTGEEESVRVGDEIKGKWKVAKIDIRSVYLKRGKEKIRLYPSRTLDMPRGNASIEGAPALPVLNLP